MVLSTREHASSGFSFTGQLHGTQLGVSQGR
jgi:hypothetical protein